MRNLKMAVAGTLCTTVILLSTLAAGQEILKAAPKADSGSIPRGAPIGAH